MDRTHDLTALFLASWRLGADREEIVGPPGALDRAMQLWVEQDDPPLPAWAKGSLHFTVGQLGVRCLELRHILAYAQHLQLVERPNPSYQRVAVTLDDDTACDLAADAGISEEEARRWGQTLRASLETAIAERKQYKVA